MIKFRINQENLKDFFLNLRNEDYLELKCYLKSNILEKFILTSLKEKNADLIGNWNNSVAFGGVSDVRNLCNLKIGQIWLLVTKDYKQNHFTFLKYILEKINCYKTDYDVLYNFIYKSNFSTLPFLKKMDFKILDTKNKDFKFFYYKKGGINFDIRNIACE